MGNPLDPFKDVIITANVTTPSVVGALTLPDVVRMFDALPKLPPVEHDHCMRCGQCFNDDVESLKRDVAIGTFVIIGYLCRVCGLVARSAHAVQQNRKPDGTWEPAKMADFLEKDPKQIF